MMFFLILINEKMRVVDYMNYGTILKKLREEFSLSQKDMAKILNISQPTYNHFETQYDIIPLKHVNSLSNFFHVSIDFLLNLTDKRNYNKSKEYLNLDLFSKRLKQFRKENNIRQIDMANVINTTHSAIAGYENKRCFMPTYALYIVCKTYNISADYLLGKIDKKIILK